MMTLSTKEKQPMNYPTKGSPKYMRDTSLFPYTEEMAG